MPKPIAVATAPVVGQGAVVEISTTTDGSGNYISYAPLKGLNGVPRVGSEGSFIEVQDIDELTKRFQKGTKTPPEWELVCKRIGDNTLQDAIIAKAEDAADEVPISVTVTYMSGDILTFQVVLNGFYMDAVEQGDNPQMFAVKGQQSGEVVRAKVA